MGIEIPRVNGNFEGGEGGGTLSCAEMAEVEPIKLPFGMWTCVGPRKLKEPCRLLVGVQIPMQRGNFEGGRAAHCKE